MVNKKDLKNIWFDVDFILSKDKLVNLIPSARGIGKTYSSIKYAIDKYNKTGRTTIYLRRYKTELKKFESIFNPLVANNEFDPKRFIVDPVTHKKLLDVENNNAPVIEALPLSQSINNKSASFNTCDLIIFDEFILDKSSLRYIPDEFELFNNFIETVARLGEFTEGRVVKVLMLANASSRNNPYFIGYNIPIIDTNLWTCDDLLVYTPDQKEFKELKEKTRWGKFVKRHTRMSEYMLDGDFKDNNNYIAKLPKKTQYIATLIYLDKKIGVYLDLNSTRLYISDKYNSNYTLTYALTLNDSTPNYLLFKKNISLFKSLKEYWQSGFVRFSNVKIQSIFIDILKIL